MVEKSAMVAVDTGGTFSDLLAVDPDGKLTIAKLNIDENPNVPTKYGVRGIPTLMIFKDGQVSATKVGALPKGKIVEWIDSSIWSIGYIC